MSRSSPTPASADHIDTMLWYLLIGVGLTAWALLLLVSSERQRRMAEIESQRQQAILAMQQSMEKQAGIPLLK